MQTVRSDWCCVTGLLQNTDNIKYIKWQRYLVATGRGRTKHPAVILVHKEIIMKFSSAKDKTLTLIGKCQCTQSFQLICNWDMPVKGNSWNTSVCVRCALSNLTLQLRTPESMRRKTGTKWVGTECLCWVALHKTLLMSGEPLHDRSLSPTLDSLFL